MAGVAREIQTRLAAGGEFRRARNRAGHRAEKHRSQPGRASAQKMSTCVGLQEACMKVGRHYSGRGCHRHHLVSAASRLSRTLATAVKATRSLSAERLAVFPSLVNATLDGAGGVF